MGILNDLFKRKSKKINDSYTEKTTWKHDLEEPERYYFPQDENDIAMLKTSIAGITHHLKISDARKPYQGRTQFDPENPVDKKAVKLVSDDGKMLGYIPSSDLSLYYNIFNDRDGIRFYGAVGIFTNDSGKKMPFGKVMIVDIPDSDDGKLFALGQKQLDFMMGDFTTE